MYQLEELDAAVLQPGEDVSIEIERGRLAAVDLLQGAARTAEDLIYGGDNDRQDVGDEGDVIYGGAGNDRLHGHLGNDEIHAMPKAKPGQDFTAINDDEVALIKKWIDQGAK